MENKGILYQHAWNFVWVLAIFGAIFYFVQVLKKSFKNEDESVSYIGKFKDESDKGFGLMPHRNEWKTILLLIGAFFAVRFSVAAISIIFKTVYDTNSAFNWDNFFGEFIKWDSHHYIGIADRWYVSDPTADARFHIVFYPMFPIFVKVFSFLCFGSINAAAFIQPNVFAALSIIVMYKLLRIDFSKLVTVISILFLIFSPYAFFFTLPFTESTFLLTTLLFMLMLKKEKWLLAGICGYVAALTKNFGLLFIVPYGVWLITVACKRRYRIKDFLPRLLPVIFILLGFGTYLLINYKVTGNWFQFMIYQKEHWYNEMTCIMQNTMNHFNWFMSYETLSRWTIFFANMAAAIGTMLAIYLGHKKIPFIYSIYTLACLFLTMMVSWLMSGPRYMLPVFPIFIAYALLADRKNKILSHIIVGVMLAIGFALSILVLTGYLCNAQIM